MSEYLFAYGTLRQEAVQLSIFGRRLKGEVDALPHYRLGEIEIQDPEFVALSGSARHRNLQFTGADADQVEGIVFELDTSELTLADSYEPEPYRRTSIRLASGKEAWVYLATADEQT